MKLIATSVKRPIFLWALLICNLFLLTFNCSLSYSQTKTYANTATIKVAQVDNPNNATNGGNTFATVKSYAGFPLGIGKYSGQLELVFPSALPANTTSFVRIDFDTDVLNALLGGNLGNLLADVLGSVVLGNHYFEVGARNGGTTVLSGTSTGAFTNANLKLIKDPNGFFYIAITPNQIYDRVYIKDVTNSLIGGTSNSTKVYGAYYNTGTDICATAYATDFEGVGLTVDALGVGGAGVTNAERAIDASETTYSQVSLGLLGVAGSISQNVYWTSTSNTGDEFRMKLSVSQALLNAGVLNNIIVKAYNGNTVVYTATLSSLLNLDLTGLLSNGQPANISFAPTQTFDRVQLTLSSLLNVNLTQTVNLYSVTRSAPRPTFTGLQSNAVNACYNSTAALTATTANTNELLWYDQLEGGTPVITPYNGSFVTAALIANKTYYVAARRINCSTESGRVAIQVTANPLLVLSANTLPKANVGKVYSAQLSSATGGTAPYNYTTTGILPAGLALSSTGQIGGVPTAAGTFDFNIVATDSKGCTVTTLFTIIVTPTLALPTASLPNGTVGKSYDSRILPAATGGSGGYTYVASNLPLGFNFDPATRTIYGVPAQAGNYVVTITVTDSDGNTIATNYNILVKEPLTLGTALLADGTVGLPYSTQTLAAANGGSTPYNYALSNQPAGLSFNAATREITGIPTQVGTFNMVLTATDADGNTATANYAIIVKQALALAPKTLADGTVGVAYATETLPAATGGAGSYTYVATNLPVGLNFTAASRQISGTPTQAGSANVMLTATDAAGNSVSQTYALKVNGVLSMPTAALPNGTVGVVYPTQILPAASGGVGTYTYTATNLPPGLNFNTTTREIYGTPTAGGTFTVAVTAADANGNTANTQYNITVNVNAPIVANATICSGTTAILTVSNLQTGVTYNWYGPTGGAAIATNNNGTFTTPIVTTNTTFYVEAISGTAVSNRIAVSVTVNPVPNAPVINTPNQSISSGQSTALQATTDAGNTISWYAAATGGPALINGPTFNTPNLTATTTYYAESRNTNGCVSNTRTAVTVTVTNGSAVVPCYAANTQSSGISGICVLCNIANPGNSTDADANNFTRITLAVGVGATGYQRLIFPAAGLATDSIRLDLATPVGLLDLTALGGVTVNVMNGSAIVNTYQLNSALVNLQLLNGNRFSATLLAGAVFDRVEVRFGALASALSSLDIYGAQLVYPAPTIAASGQTICSGSTTTLTAIPNGTTTLAWYNAATGGSMLANSNTLNTPALTVNTTYYIEISRNGCAAPTRIPVTVTVAPVLTTPVVAAVSPSCSGATAVLSVTNPDPTIIYNWYDVVAGGTPVFTGATFTTPALTADKTYYVEAAVAGCVSATRGSVTVTVNPSPLSPTVQASATTVSAGQTATITATSTESNVAFDWYTTSSGGTPVYSGSTFVTPPLTTTTSYYVAARNTITGCASTTRVHVTITVDGTVAPIPVPCESAVAQSNGVTGVALLARVANAELAIDDDAQTASTLIMPVGVVGASVYQRLVFGSLSNVGDTVRVLVTSRGKLLSAALLGNVILNSYNGATSNNENFAANNALISVELLSGSTQARLTFVPTNPFDAVEVRLNSGALTALASLDVNYAQHVIAKPEIAAANVSACANQTTVLTVQNPKPNLIYKWFDASGNYIAGSDGVSFTTPVLAANTRYFVAASSVTGCISTKTAVDVTVVPAPLAPELVNATINVCTGNDAILQVKNPVGGLNYKWYDGAGAYQAGKDGITFTIPNVTSNTTYSVEAVNSCNSASPRTSATVNVGATDLPVITPASASVSAGSPVILTATSSTAGAVFNWYATAASPTILYTGPTYVTDPLTVTTTFFVEAVSPGLCPSAGRASVIVTVVTDNTSGTVPCESADVVVTDGVTGIAIGAGVVNQNLAVDNLIQTGSTLYIPAAVGASVFQRVGFSSGLSTVGDTLHVRLTSPGKLLSLSVLPSITVTTYNGAASNNDAVTANNPLLSIELASDNSAIIISYVPTLAFDRVQVNLNSGLLGALNSINFNYAQRSHVAPQVTAGTNSACEGNSAVLSVVNPQLGIVYKWYLENTYQAGADGPTFTTPSNLAAGTYNFYVRAVVNGCEGAPTKVVVTLTAKPVPPVLTPTNPTSTCINKSVSLSVQPVTGVSFNWYDVNGNVLVLNSNTYTTPASLAVGSYSFFVEAVNASNCVAATRTQVSITVNPGAQNSDIQISGNTSICGSAVTTLTASSALVNPIFSWYTDAALQNKVHEGASYITPTITATTTYYVTVSGTGICANAPADAKSITITLNDIAVASDINLSGNSTICSGSTVVLTAASTTVTNPIFSWYTDPSLTNKVYEGVTYTSDPLTSNTVFYVTVKGDDKCENTSSTAKAINITVNNGANNTAVLITGNTAVCQGSTAMLTASSTTVTNPTFSWYTDPNLATKVYEGANFTTPQITGTTIYYVTVKGDGTCETSAANAKMVTVTVNGLATAADIILSDANTCAGSSAILLASSMTVTKPVFNWYSDPSLTVLVHTGPTFTTPNLSSTTLYYVTVQGDNKCANTAINAKVVTVNVNAVGATTDIIVTGNTTTCAGTTVALSATSVGIINPVYTWYGDPDLTNVVYIGNNFTSNTLTSTTTYYVTVKGDNRCENTAATAKPVIITVNPAPLTPIVATTGTNICAGTSTTLTIQNVQAGVTYEWYDAPTNGTLVGGGSVFNTLILNTTTAYYVQAVSSSNCIGSSGRVKVTVTVTPKPMVPIVAANSVNACIGKTAVLVVTNAAIGVTYTWYTAANGGTSVGTGANFITPTVTATVIYYVEASSGSCISTARTAVTVNALPVPVAPATVTAANNLVCTGTTALLTVNNPDPNLTYRWYTTAMGGTSLFEGNPYTTAALATTTTYYVESIAVGSGCPSATRTPITITVLPVLAAPVVTVQSKTGTSITFAWNVVPGATGYEVSLNNGSTWVAPSSGPLGTTYTVAGLIPAQLVTIVVRAKGQTDCQTSANSTPLNGDAANPFGNQLYIPNTFTPNGDGKNDTFFAYGNSVAKFRMRVYNQWGALIYESNTLQSGWDGTYKGVLQPNGVYVYYIESTFNDGSTKVYKGTVNVLR